MDPSRAREDWGFSDVKAAWKGVTARGWAALFLVVLLGLAMASNVVMFAFADSLVFAPDPIPGGDRLVHLSSSVTPPERYDKNAGITVQQAWRQQADVFSAVAVEQQKTLFLVGSGPAERTPALDVSPEFFDVMGVQPRWGRGFRSGDEADPSVMPVVISEAIARARFGSPNRAPGQTLEASAGPLLVLGVMDASFAHPTPTTGVWRVVDLLGPLMRDAGGTVIARVAPGVNMENLPALLAARASMVGASAGLTTYAAKATPLLRGPSAARRTTVLVLIGAALCLLLGACANAASIELAGAVQRMRVHAIQLALGASRARLARVAALEVLVLVVLASILAIVAAWAAFAVLRPNLPASLMSNNRLDLDGRVAVFMVLTAAVTWLFSAAPAVMAASRASLVSIIKAGDRTAASSRRAAFIRRALTVGQIAVAVTLVIGGLLYARSYRNLLAVDKGFDSRDLYSVDWTMPANYFTSAGQSADFNQRAVDALRAAPGVAAVMRSSPPPSVGDSPMQSAIEIDDRPPASPPELIGRKWIDQDYFRVITLPLKQGRLPRPDDPQTNVVVPEQFARRLFADGRAVGHTFRRSPREPWLTIIGVVGDFRTDRTRMPAPTDRQIYFYWMSPPVQPATPANAPAAPQVPAVDSGVSSRFFTLTVRVKPGGGPAALVDAGRRVDPKLTVSVESVDDEYATKSADTRLASEIVAGFSIFAFGISMAGMYGVMAFLVAGRTREIGVRMALGADLPAVRRLVLGSSARLAVIGAGLGLGMAFLSARWVQSELFGVSATDPAVFAVAALSVVATAVGASWPPARQASRVDPVVALRSE
ncbi:MAG TPA: ABC transporter permease [Vicinamibacterales bacterium]|nr:ABC transporter permease [Vicinamibacterales bacterium]